MQKNNVLILDFGSQYTQLIARRVRELNNYCEIYPYHKIPDITRYNALILSGSPFSVQPADAPRLDWTALRGKIPILAICYGAQYLAHHFGGSVIPSEKREYGRANLSYVKQDEKLLESIPLHSQVWMSHGDTITQLPTAAQLLASTPEVVHAGFKMANEKTYGIQFHPEVFHTTDGTQLLKNFLRNVAEIEADWTPDAFITSSVHQLKEQLGDQKVILGLSGGVDSTVAAVLLHRAIGKQLHCIFVNNGLLRKNEYTEVLDQYQGLGLQVKGIDAAALFYEALDGVRDPEEKRKKIGKVFVQVFEEAAQQIAGAKWLAQGTIYPDVIESISIKGPSATIKSHHNVGGLPDAMQLKIVEPLRMLFKDEVRRIGKNLELGPELLGRHPFPGPGLAIRILGPITREKVSLLQEVDSIFIQLLKENGWYDRVWQAGAILLPIQSVGVMGDERTYEQCVALRAVSSTDGMTADWVNLPYPLLQKISNSIINQVKGINRVVYDISSKPPATIEWE